MAIECCHNKGVTYNNLNLKDILLTTEGLDFIESESEYKKYEQYIYLSNFNYSYKTGKGVQVTNQIPMGNKVNVHTYMPPIYFNGENVKQNSAYTNTAMGGTSESTEFYIPPYINNTKSIDIWGLGCLFHEFFFGALNWVNEDNTVNTNNLFNELFKKKEKKKKKKKKIKNNQMI